MRRLGEHLPQLDGNVQATDGASALGTALAVAPVLILFDVTTNGQSGEALLRAFRNHDRLARTPILCVTASAEMELRASLLRAGADDCLSEPSSPEEIQARVANVLGASRERTAQERLTTLAEQSPDGVFLADASGRFVGVNEAGCRILGYTRAEILGKTALDFAASEGESRAIESALAALRARGGGTQLVERRLRRKDGSLVTLEVHAQLLPDGYRQSFVRDISARRRVEAELRRSEARAASILSTSADAIISLDVTGRITGWNQGAEQIFGYSRKEALGAPLGLILPERLHALYEEKLAQCAAGAEISRFTRNWSEPVFGLSKSGREFPADASISKVVVDGEMILTVTLRDITEQRRSESEQRLLSEAGAALLALGLEEAQDQVVRAACESFADFAVLLVHEPDGSLRPAAAVGPGREGARGVRLSLQPPERTPTSAVWRAFETRSPVLWELTPEPLEAEAEGDALLRSMKAARLRGVVAVPLCAGEQCLGVLGLGSAARVFDARDVRIAEELARRCALSIKNARLHQAERRAIQVRDEILGIVAHDLRNPLNAICLYLNMLLKRRSDPGERWIQPTEMIRSAARRMDRIIQDLLDVAQLESGALSIELQPVSVAQVLADAVEAQKPLAADASIELRLEPVPELPRVLADPHRLLQVLQNLLSNAIKFSSRGGVVTIGAEVEEGAVRFRVRDTGVGIPPENISHLFDRFWQAQKTDRRGAGLGLFIVKGIVAAHGGRVWVESTPGRGSTFFFTIPLRPLVP